MKKKFLFLFFITFCFFLLPEDAHAFSSQDYQDKALCGNFEVAGFHSDGLIVPVSCQNTFEEARNWMRQNGADDLAIMTKVNNKTAIVDANVALLDLVVSPDMTNVYTTENLTYAFTYMYASAQMGGIDGALLDATYSNNKNMWVAKVKIADRVGWIEKINYEIVPITWVKSSSSYTVTNDYIRHNYVSKIQNDYTGSSGSTIGPKPDMLNTGTYYSYDGHYFYSDRTAMIKDYKNGNYQNAVNKNDAYYNYYMYLSNHTKTSYSSMNIDEYIRSSLGATGDTYGNASENGTSRLYGKGTFFYYAQEKYGVNALLALSLSRNETGNGRSDLAINKNNGFGLDAVDSSPIESAKWYATFANSILGYASKWITYGYAHPRDWRYFGPQFGNKLSGMNVKYASDAFWSEKMAAHYYSFDKSKGLQDYNYYQLGVTTQSVDARRDASESAQAIYNYPEAEDAVVIVGEKKGSSVNGNTTWYQVVSDLNIDGNYNEITNTDYNWNATVYVPAAYVKKINKGKKGYISPNSVTEYQDRDYEYDLLTENTTLKPKVGLSVKNTDYYYDSALTSRKGQTLLSDRYVMIYAIAYNKDNEAVSYLVTSDYSKDQKEWVAASSIKIVANSYGKTTITLNPKYNWYTEIWSEMKENSTQLGTQYTNSYIPILEEKQSSGKTWYKVPLDLSGNLARYGWMLQSYEGVTISKNASTLANNPPRIEASDKTIVQGTKYNPLDGVRAEDDEDGNLTSKIEVVQNPVNIDKVGKYQVIYRVRDNANQTTTKTITVTVIENEKPVIQAEDRRVEVHTSFNPLDGVTATDKEDGNLTSKIVVRDNSVDLNKTGEYQVTYQVTDSYQQTTTKVISVYVLEDIDMLVEKTGSFYFDSLKDVDGKLTIKGYNAIQGVQHSENTKVTFDLIFENIDTGDEIKQALNQIRDKKEMTRPVYSTDDKDYTYSWFKGAIDVDKLSDGDYRMYIVTTADKTYAKTLVTNKILKDQVATYQGKKTITTRDNYQDGTAALELIVRSDKIALKTANSFYNAYNQYRTFAFEDNLLHLKGTSYSIGMDLNKARQVEREIIFENTKTYQKYRYSLGSITDGLYQVGQTLGDNMDKTRAWFDAKIDLKNIPKGNYAIYIRTKSNVEDFGELTELLLRKVDDVKWKYQDKSYSFKIRDDLRYRIELEVQ